MDQKKMGEFIKKLREEKGFTQEKLAKELSVTRYAISKWETGVNAPDIETLKRLSNIFNISLEELIDNGEDLPKVSISKDFKEFALKTIDDNSKLKRKIKTQTKVLTISSVVLIILLAGFLTYYFVNSYGKIHIYKVTGNSNNFDITSGLFVRTREKTYFNLGTIVDKNNNKADIVELYYIKNNEERLIVKGDSNNIILQENYGYNEYFPLSDIDLIINNIYIRFYKNKKEIESFKLSIQEDYVNNSLFFKKNESIIYEDKPVVKHENPDRVSLVAKIKNKFRYREEEDAIYYSLKDGNLKKTYWLTPVNDEGTIGLMISDQKGNDLELYLYDYDSNLEYCNYSLNYCWNYSKNEFLCLQGSCEFLKEKVDKFLVDLNKIFE